MRRMKNYILLVFIWPVFAFSQNVNPDGYNKFLYPDGKVSSEGNMVNGKPEGYWKTYYPNGKVKSEGNRKNFVLDSVWKFYTEDGKIQQEFSYRNGKKNGPKRIYGKDAKLESEETYVDDVKHGPVTYFYKNGALQKKINFIQGREEGAAYEYDQDGTIITLIDYKAGFIKFQEKINRKDKNGLKQGIWKEFYSEGKVKLDGRYLDDKKNGYFKEYDTRGNLVNTVKFEYGKQVLNAPELAKMDTKTEYHENGRKKYVGNFKNDIPEGVHREYKEDGTIQNAYVFREGVLIGEGILNEGGFEQGPWKEYHPTGELKGKGEYLNGKRIGEWVFYHPNGKLEQKGKYDKKGRAQGEWKWYYESGNILREETFIDDLSNGMMTEYSDSTTVITKGEFIDGLKEGPWFFEMTDYREEGNYKGDKRDGLWKHFYTADKQLRFEGNFIDGNPDGKHEYYYPNGNPKEIGKYVFGRKEGDWKYFSEDGQNYLTITFKDDAEVKFDGVKIKLDDYKK